MKTYLGEVLDDTNTASGFALMGVIGGLGRFIGPLIGCYLFFPGENYSLFESTLFDNYPLALPSAVVAVCSFITLFLANSVLPETLKAVITRSAAGKNKRSIAKKVSSILRRGAPEYSAISSADYENDHENENDGDTDNDVLVQKNRMYSVNSGGSNENGLEYNGIYSKHTDRNGVKSIGSSIGKKTLPLGLNLTSLTSLTLPSRIEHVGHSFKDQYSSVTTPTTARIEASFPDHFRDSSDTDYEDDVDNRLNPCINLTVMNTHTHEPSLNGSNGTTSSSSVAVMGENGNGVNGVDDREDRRIGSFVSNPLRENLFSRIDTLIAVESSRPSEDEGDDSNIDLEMDCLSEAFKTLDGCGKRIGKDNDNRDSSRESSRKEKEKDNELDKDAPNSPRRVSFSSLVMVKVIGSSSLGIGQLKHLRADDHPVDDSPVMDIRNQDLRIPQESGLGGISTPPR